MKISEAVCNEEGTGRGGSPGDQTGRELRTRDWYDRASSGGWDCCLVPTSNYYAEKAADLALRIVKSRRCGYDRDKRLTLYKALKSAAWVPEEMELCSADCSSLVCAVYIGAGIPDLSPAGTTKNLEKLFIETGYFIKRPGTEEYGCLGAVYVKAGAHTCIVTEASAAPDEETKDRVRTKGNVRIREAPVTGKKIRTAHNEVLEVIGQDAATGWWHVPEGWVTNNTRYTEII